MAHIRYFAAAAEAAGCSSEDIDSTTLGALTDAIVAAHGDGFARVLARCSVLVDGRQSSAPETAVGASSLVDVLPPFAGG